VSIYWTWSYPWESNRDVSALDNRFSTMIEVRRTAWPAYETREWDASRFLQGVAGTLELFHRSTLSFQRLAGELAEQPVAVYQRIDQAGIETRIDERILDDTDTLMVFGLDHLPSDQEAGSDEIEAIRAWLEREGTCLLLSPHHDVGFTADLEQRQVEYLHHGDPLVPRQQRFGRYTRSLMAALDVPVINRWGLRPAVVERTGALASMETLRDLDELRLLDGVSTFNYHSHLPHYELTEAEPRSVRVLARTLVDPVRPHPFTAAGNRALNALLWMPPEGRRAGHLLMADSTIFTTLFGGSASLERFWRNLVSLGG